MGKVLWTAINATSFSVDQILIRLSKCMHTSQQMRDTTFSWKIDECNLTKIDWITWPERWNWKFYFDSLSAHLDSHAPPVKMYTNMWWRWNEKWEKTCRSSGRSQIVEVRWNRYMWILCEKEKPKIYCVFELEGQVRPARIFDFRDEFGIFAVK